MGRTRSHLSYAKQSEPGGWMDFLSLSFLGPFLACRRDPIGTPELQKGLTQRIFI